MAWIESHQSLKDHPKTAALCELLGAERPPVVGHLHLLWWWCIDYAPDGVLTKYTNGQISRAAEWRGDADTFVKALITAGFIDRGRSTVIHDWLVFCGPLMERRLARMAAKRPPMGAERTPTNQPTVPNQPNRTVPTNRTKGRMFVKPTAAEVGAYAKAIGFELDGQKFIDYYESKGWVIGKSPMKSWQACVRTWKSNGYGGSNGIAKGRVGGNQYVTPDTGKYAGVVGRSGAGTKRAEDQSVSGTERPDGEGVAKS